ncbi:transmembrane protein 87A-like isoform X1 [Varroa jacobsoni]|uniref:transmembrane protein 87A-like isoform X1 n=1 Tax=Varroa jacobsoni TaxID=62625 RepID=UPI000BF6024B|nr:transmembrane protein 87A-like isoform X1 [Varroa jacobsoni]XP_022691928.1 transmembrane protein 87A-like isoform X1 [Varroa jacobsoni]
MAAVSLGSSRCIIPLLVAFAVTSTFAFPDQGKWSFHGANVTKFLTVNHKSLYRGSTISVKISCQSHPSAKNETPKVQVSWKLYRTPCYQDYLEVEYLHQDELVILFDGTRQDISHRVYASPNETHDCLEHFQLKPQFIPEETISPAPTYLPQAKPVSLRSTEEEDTDFEGLTRVNRDGIYMLLIRFENATNTPFNLSVDVSMKGEHGYLSAVEWPYLPFFGTMCLVYTMYAIGWTFVCALAWKELLRIQFWIGGVIFLGLLEKATFYAEYESINNTGHSVRGAILFAELVSCLKRSLARLLVIIVSLGFGIIKPRLGDMLQRVLLVGGLYFILALGEGAIRELKPKTTPDRTLFSLSMCLALLDSAICYWIFTSLVQTTRTLTLRRNIIKLTLYRHFTNTLVFSVLASGVFLVWVVLNHRMSECISDWKELWFDDAYWQILFSIILLVIMVLWRPTNNNNRFAFTPLLDNPDDENDPNDTDTATLLDVSHVKQRQIGPGKSQPPAQQIEAPPNGSIEEDLKWIEAHVPTDAALGKLVDSEEEILTVQFERNKML